jgi:hypothetical protein
VADNFNGKTVVLVACDWRSGAHAITASHRRGIQQVIDALYLNPQLGAVIEFLHWAPEEHFGDFRLS